MLARVAALVCGRAKPTLWLTGLFIVVAGWAGATVGGRLTSGGQGFVRFNSPSVVAQRSFISSAHEFTSADVVAVVRTPPAAMRPTVARLVAALRAEPSIARVDSILNDHTGAVVSKDGRATYVAAFFHRRVLALNGISALARRLPGVTVAYTGSTFTQINDQLGRDVPRIEAIAVPLLVLLSFIVFRGLVAALLPIFVAAVAVGGTMIGLRVLVELTSVSSFALNLATGLGFGLAIDYALFMVSRYREELARSGPGSAALTATLATAGRTVVFSATTVAVALLCLFSFGAQTLTSMGIAGALVAVMAAAAALLPMSALLVVLGERVNGLAPLRLQRAAQRSARPVRAGGWYGWSHGVMRRAPLVTVLCVAGLLAAGLPALHAHLGGTDGRVLPSGYANSRVVRTIAEDFPADASNPVQILVRPPASASGQVAAYAARLRRLPGAFDVRRSVVRGGSVVSVISRGVPTSPTSQRLVEDVLAVRTPLRVAVTGSAAVSYDAAQTIRSRFPLAIGLVCLTMVIVLFAMTRSVVLPIKSLVMNAVTITATWGLLILIFQDGGLSGLLGFQPRGFLDQTNIIVLLFVVLGLSTDYGVFLLARITEAHDAGLPNREAVAVGLERSGRIVTAAALLFCVAVGATAGAQVAVVKEFGIGAALAVLIDATIVRALLVPALMALLGSANWWAPAPLRDWRAWRRARRADRARS